MNYLLGNLPEEEKERVEERMFADDDFYERIEALKADLADEFARGELTASKRKRFEQRFLNSAQGYERVAFARAMAKAFEGEKTAESEKIPWRRSVLAYFGSGSAAWRFSMAAAMLLMASVGVWLFFQNRDLQSQLEGARSEQSKLQKQESQWRQRAADGQTRSDELAAQLERERAEREKLRQELDQARDEGSSTSKSAFVSFLLSPGLIRDRDEPEKLVIPPGARRIRLQLDTAGDDEYRGFRAELRTARGALVWSQDRLSTQPTDAGKAVPLILPANILAAGEYELTLKAVESKNESKDIGYYYFIILKK